MTLKLSRAGIGKEVNSLMVIRNIHNNSHAVSYNEKNVK
jgi:hypothetical protein